MGDGTSVPTPYRAAKADGAGHGGRVLVSAATERLLESAVGRDWRLLDPRALLGGLQGLQQAAS